MAASMPGDVGTEPESRLVFNAPFDQPQSISCRLTNKGGKKIGWAIKTTNMRRFGIEPACGVLEPKAQTQLSVSDPPRALTSDLCPLGCLAGV